MISANVVGHSPDDKSARTGQRLIRNMKKINEMKLFELTYPQFQTVIVTPSEAPDFLCHIDNAPILGVEVTEFFKNEGYARLNKIHDYPLQLLDDRRFRNRQDKKLITVVTAKIKNPDGKFEQEIKVIFDPGMTGREIMECVNSTLRKKCKKGDSYLKAAPEIDLIIHDAAEMFSSNDRQAIFRTISHYLDRSLLTFPFREIFLVITKRNGKILKLPLKLAMFLEDIYIFEKLICEDLVLKNKSRFNEKFYVLFYCLEQKGYGEYKVNTENNKITIIVGSHEYSYAATGKTIEWRPFQRGRHEKKYEKLSDCIADKTEYEVEIGQRLLDERGKLSCFIDAFTEHEYNQEDKPEL